MRAVVIGGLATAASPAAASAQIRPLFDGLFSNSSAMAKIGRYVDWSGLDPTPAELERALLKAMGVTHSKWRAQPTNAQRRLVSNSIRADYASGRTLRVDGWVLSETEARLCRIAYLSSNRTTT